MKLITETDCPHCKQKHEAELDLDNFELPQIEKPKMTVKSTIPTQITEPTPQLQAEPTQEPQIKTKVKVPAHIPKFKCKNCDKLHDNPDYSKLPRFKCKNCDQLNPTPQCEFCNNEDSDDFDELSNEDFENMGIRTPNHEHEHEHNEDE